MDKLWSTTHATGTILSQSGMMTELSLKLAQTISTSPYSTTAGLSYMVLSKHCSLKVNMLFLSHDKSTRPSAPQTQS